MRTLDSELQKLLSAQPEHTTHKLIASTPTQIAVQTVSQRHKLQRLIAKFGSARLNSLRYVCEVARDSGKPAKVKAAQIQLLDFVGYMSNKGATAEEFAAASDGYCQAHLCGVSANLLGPSPSSWYDSATLWRYCVTLHEQDGYCSLVKRW